MNLFNKEIIIKKTDISELMSKNLTFEQLALEIEKEYSPVLGKLSSYGNGEVKWEKDKYFYYYIFESGYKVKLLMY